MLCLAALLGPRGLAGQDLVTAFGRYQLDVWRLEDGVRLAFTSNLVETRDGYLWLSSESGVTRFDGVRFAVFDGSNAPALRGRPRLQTVPLLEDHAGVLWIGSDVGLFAYQGGVMRPAALDTSLTIDQVNAALVDPGGTIWGVTRSGRVIRIPPGGRLHEVHGAITSYSGSSLAVDPSGDIWIAAGDRAVYRVHGDSLLPLAFPPGLLVDDPNRAYVTSDSTVWFGTRTALIALKAGRFRRIPLPDRGGLGALSTIQEGPDGRLWIGTHGAGLYLFDGERFQSFTAADGLSDDRVIEILRDRAGNMWVATRDGLNRFRRLPFQVLTRHDGLPAAMPGAMIGEPSGTTWLAPPTGGLFVGRLDSVSARFTAAEPVRNYDRVTALAPARGGGVWAGHLLGTVSRHLSGAAAAAPVAAGLPPVTEVLEDADGTLWIGTWRGLFRLRAGRRDSLTRREGLRDDFVHRLHRTGDGVLWVATQTGVVRSVDPAGERFEPVPLPDGSANRAITLFEAPAGTLWLGSAEGLTRVTGGRPAFLSLAAGLPGRWVGSGNPDAHGHLWLGQLGGLTRVNLAELLAVADGRATTLASVTTFRALDGLPGGDPGAWPHPWTFTDPAGRLWVAMGHGIVVTDPAQAVADASPPPIHLEEVWVDGAPVPRTDPLVLAPGARRVELRYTGVDLTDGPAVRFRHQLEGYDTTWTDVGARRTVSYTGLPPGTYHFRVTGRAGRGDWHPAGASLALVVEAPLWRRTWFIAAALLAAAATLWTLHRARLQARTDAIREERTRLAREIHDSLLQGFGGISLQLHAVAARLPLAAGERSAMDRVLQLLDGTLTQARAAVWDMRLPGGATLPLAVEVEAAAARALAEGPTAVTVTTQGRPRALSPACHSEALRIVEEALANVRQHAAATRVTVMLAYGWRRLECTIADDGRGFDLAQDGRRPGHWGLLGMRERASRIGARLGIATRPGQGTTITVAIPYRLGWRERLRWPRAED
ncbi:MAG: hypothetical protein IPK12_01325 [Gemmatimonadetes bacterium]|nr:hypothetical protein [Gemmatimonadota bacterium]